MMSRGRVWHDSPMSDLRVLEYVRDDHGVWNLPEHELAPIRERFPSVRLDSARDRDEVARLLPDADVVLGWAVRPENFATAARLKWIHVTAAGLGNLLFPELVASDVVVTNARGMHATAMAEHALGVMLAFVRRLHVARDAQARRAWVQDALWTDPPSFGELAGSTLGLVGLGAVGSAIAARARAFGMRVVAVRRRPAADPAPADVQWGPERLDAMLAQCDWLVLAPPLTAETRGLMDRRRLALLRPHAVLVNLGRGALVDEAALVEALASGRIGGAALDVFEREPLPESSPLWSMPNVIVTPHVAGTGPRYWARSVELFARNLDAWIAGRPLENVVDKRAGY